MLHDFICLNVYGQLNLYNFIFELHIPYTKLLQNHTYLIMYIQFCKPSLHAENIQKLYLPRGKSCMLLKVIHCRPISLFLSFYLRAAFSINFSQTYKDVIMSLFSCIWKKISQTDHFLLGISIPFCIMPQRSISFLLFPLEVVLHSY